MTTQPPAAAAQWHRAAVAAIVALTLAELLWEIVLAPLRPGGSWLALKALPLALLCAGLARGSLQARKAAALILPLYFGEAILRAVSEGGRHRLVAAMAAALALAAFATLLMSFRRARAGH